MQSQLNKTVDVLRQLFQEKRYNQLDLMLNQMERVQPKSMLVHQFKAISAFEQQKYKDSLNNFLFCRDNGPWNSEIELNIASCLSALKSHDKAIETAALVLEKNDKFKKRAVNFLLKKTEHIINSNYWLKIESAAESVAMKCPKTCLSLVRAYLEKEQVEKAEVTLESIANSAEASSYEYLLLRAQVLRLNGKSHTAQAILKTLITNSQPNFALFHTYANCYSDQNEYSKAINYYQKAIELNVSYACAHKNLAELLFEQGYTETFLDSYNRCEQLDALTPEILKDYLFLLVRIRNYIKIDELVSTYSDLLSSAQQKYYRMEAARIGNSPSLAMSMVETSSLSEFDNEKLCQLAQFCLSEDRKAKATEMVNLVLSRNSRDQWALSLLPLCSAIPCYHEKAMAQYEDYICEYTIEAPVGFANLNEYLTALTKYLDDQHVGKTAPIDQTLNNGTQTRGNLFLDSNPLIEHLKAEFTTSCKRAISVFNNLPEPYPDFLKVVNETPGPAWSVNLLKTGYHSNHIHPMGCLSSVCYISLPKTNINSSDGWLSFGKVNFEASHNSERKRIKPEPGKLVIFPSYFWHGTYPFFDNGRRLTVACDFLPTDKFTKE